MCVSCTVGHIIFRCLLYVQVLQNIGNLCPEMDAKEMFMYPMARLLPEGVKRVKVFIQELVQIDQKEGENLTS